MIFLVSNDDGIAAEGIQRLVSALSQVGSVYVSAPHTQRSATGHGITINKGIDVREIPFKDAEKAWETTGTPADCVKLGISLMEAEGVKPDMVFTGINHGGNLGRDTLYSGTVSAAAEGSFCGIQSVAVSVDSHSASHFELACELAIYAAKELYGKMSSETVININTPNLPKDEIKGIKVVKIGVREYSDHYVLSPSKEGQYVMVGEPIEYTGEDRENDVAAVGDGFATITPIHYDITDYNMMNEVYITMEKGKTILADRNESILLAIDFQEKLMPAMENAEHTTESMVKLANGFRALGVPIIATTQYARGLGNTVEPLAKIYGEESTIIDKKTFSCCSNQEFMDKLEATGRKVVFVTGAEAHICVMQTALELMQRGYCVYVVADCVDSRNSYNKGMALSRMEAAGVIVTTYEAVLYELLKGAGEEGFKEISNIVK